jgi:methionyl-tRNA formyltransferase
MKLVFFGTPEFAVPSLRALLESGHAVARVITQPDEPKGRGRRLAPPPVKVAAHEAGIPVLQPAGLEESLLPRQVDAAVVVAYGKIIPEPLLEIPRRGFVNVHASLLPKYRGAAPVAWAIRNGDSVTGVTTMQMAKRLDTGDILLQKACEISPRETAGELHDRLAETGAGLLVETLRQWEAGALAPKPQDGSQATYAPKLTKRDGLVPWDGSARAVDCHVRAMTPWPGAFGYLEGRYVKILRGLPIERTSRPSEAPGPSVAGEILALEADGLLVGCGEGAYRVERIQPEGRRAMSGREFLAGRPKAIGRRFEGKAPS